MSIIHFPALPASDLAWPPGIGTADDRARFARYDEFLTFVEGAQWPARRKPGEPRLTFNYARTLVRKTASYVFPAPASFVVPVDGDQTAANRAERALAAVIATNDLARLDVELCVEASVLGDAALKVTWDADARAPAVVAVDPATLIAWTSPDNPRRLLRMAQRYGMTGTEIAASHLLPSKRHALDPGRIYPVVEEWSSDRWTVSIAGQKARDEPNPYGWIPYVIAANNQRPHAFWGESDLADLLDVCRELNRRMSVLSHILELSGAPIAVLENVDGSEGIAVGPGARWELPEGSKAYLLDLLGKGGVGLHIDYVNVLFRVLHDLSETPRTAFGDSGRTISGAALEVEIQPLVQKVARKRRHWDALYQTRNLRILDLLERFGGEDFGGLRQTLTIWPSVLPSDAETAVRNAVSLVETGIQSRRTAIANLGSDDPDAELARIAAERPTFSTPRAVGAPHASPDARPVL